MSEDRHAALEAKLDTIIRLLALELVKGKTSQKEQILLLSQAGLESKNIAELLSTTRNTVNVAISTAKKDRG